MLNGLHLLLLVLGAVVAFSFGFLLIDRAGDSNLVEGVKRTELALWAAFIGAVCAYAVFGGLFLVRCLSGTLRVVQSVSSEDRTAKQRLGTPLARMRAWWRRHPVVRWLLEIVSVLGIVWTAVPVRRVHLLRRLRHDARHYLFVLAGFLTLIVVTTGARRRAVLALDPQASFPVEYVLLYGLVFAGILGPTYCLASAAVDRRAEHLVDEYAALPSPDLGDDELGGALERRQRVAQLFSTGESTWSTLQTRIVILGPLLTGIVSAALPEQ